MPGELSKFADGKHLTAMSRFTDTFRTMFSQWWVIFWLVLIILCGIGVTVFMTCVMEAPWMGRIAAYTTLFILLLYLLFIYWIFRN